MSGLAVLLALIALGVALAALFIALQCRAKLGGGSTPAEEIRQYGKAGLRVKLVKHPSLTQGGKLNQDYRLTISNEGPATAHNLLVEVDLEEEMLFQQECNEKLPCASLAPGEELSLCTRIGVRTPKVFNVILRWQNGDGSNDEQAFAVTKALA